MTELVWTKARPSIPGWYWVRIATEPECAVPVRIDEPVPPNEFSELEFSNQPLARPIEPAASSGGREPFLWPTRQVREVRA